MPALHNPNDIYDGIVYNAISSLDPLLVKLKVQETRKPSYCCATKASNAKRHNALNHLKAYYGYARNTLSASNDEDNRITHDVSDGRW